MAKKQKMNGFLIFKDSILTQFAQHADLFVSSHVVVMPTVFIRAVHGYGSKELDAVRKIADDDRRYSLIACHTPKFEWRDVNVKSVSDGFKWMFFNDLIELNRVKLTMAVETTYTIDRS